MSLRVYIFITNSIYGYGGAQLLTLRRAKFLKSQGWKVLIIYRRKMGDFLLKNEFSDFTTLYIPEFSSHYNFVNKSCLNKIIDNIYSMYRDVDVSLSIIESNDLVCAVWAEHLSSILKIKHVLYMLSEENMSRLFFYPYKRFYNYKLVNNELWACNSRGLDISFQKSLKNYKNNYINVAFDDNEIPNCSIPNIDWNFKRSNSIVISTLTRLEKSYLWYLFDILEKMCNEKMDIDVCFIVAGGTVDNNVREKIENRAKEINERNSNLRVIITGYIKPGKDFYNNTDIFIGVGTAAISALSQSCIVLPFNPLTNKTPGVFGVETFNFAYAETTKEYDISDKIFSLLLLTNNERKEIAKTGKSYFAENYTLESTYINFNKLIGQISNKGCYSFKYAFIFKPLDYFVEFLRVIRNKINKGDEKKWIC